MALRMFLVAMVVAMSLPLPNSNRCNLLLEELKTELSATVGSIQNEWPRVEQYATLADVKPDTPIEQPLAMVQPPAETRAEALESPLELAFSVIVEEYARDAATHLSVDEARDHVAMIPMPDMDHPLPPAPEATELLAHQQSLALIAPPAPIALPVDGPIGPWEAEFICLESEQMEPVAVELGPISVASADIGPWADFLDGIEIASKLQLPQNEQPPQLQVVDTALPDHWLEIVNVAQIEITPQAANAAEKPPVVISKALRLTAEALAAWTQVVVRPY